METWPGDPPIRMELTDAGITLTWPNSAVDLPRLWLRDNCPCMHCHHAETGEHAVLLANEPADQRVAGASLVNGELHVEWSTGHLSRYSSAWFQRIVNIDAVSRARRILWLAPEQPMRVAHHDLFAEPSVMVAALARLQSHGAVVVTGVPTEPGEVERFLERMGAPLRELPFDRVHNVFVDPQGYNVAHSDQALPPHNDFASYTWPPSGQLLHFLVNDAAGGDSVLVDGFAAVARLEREAPDAVRVLERVAVPFREFSATAESFTRAPLIRRDANGNVVGLRFSNQLMQPLQPDHPDVEAWYYAYHHLSSILTDPAHQVSFRSNAGDMQMLHSHRVLHARRKFEPSTGARHLQDAYFEADDMFNRLARLNGELQP